MMFSKSSLNKTYLLPTFSSIMVVTGAGQMIASPTLHNPVFMILLLSSGLLNFVCGMIAGISGKKGYVKGSSQSSRLKHLMCLRILLSLTTVFLVTALTLVHIQRSRVIQPWPDTVTSGKPIIYHKLSEAFDRKGIWFVTTTSIVGATSSLLAFIATFTVGVTSSFSPHDNLATIESLGWVYKPSPRPDVLENCPSTKFLQSRVEASRYKRKKSVVKSTSVTLVSFRHDHSLNRHVTLPARTNKEKLVFVDSTPLGPTLPMNMVFGKNASPIDGPCISNGRNVSSKPHSAPDPLGMVHKF